MIYGGNGGLECLLSIMQYSLLANLLLKSVLCLLDNFLDIGWGTHLVLPRERVMAVRFVCSKAYRINRLATILNVEEQEIERKFEHFNLKQSYFYKKVFNREKASTQEFDLVINCDYIKDPKWAAEIVEENFRKKFSIKTGKYAKSIVS